MIHASAKSRNTEEEQYVSERVSLFPCEKIRTIENDTLAQPSCVKAELIVTFTCQ